MNIDTVTTTPLLRANGQHHENARCVECTAGTPVRGATWYKAEDLATLRTVGLPVFYDGENVLMMPIGHTLVTGSTGTGKTEVFYKNVLHLLGSMPEDACPSFLTTDLKGDISEAECAYLRARGYEVLVLDMRHPFQSTRYNFLTEIFDAYHERIRLLHEIKKGEILVYTEHGVRHDTSEEAICAANARAMTLFDEIERTLTDLSHIIVPDGDPKDRTWVEGARTMLRAIIFTMLRDSEDDKNGMTRETFTFANVCRAAFSTGEDCEEICTWLEPAQDILCVRSALTGNYRLRAKVTRDGYISTLNTGLAAFSANSFGALTATADDFSMDDIAKSQKPYAIFLITDDRQKTTNSLAMIFINNLIARLTSAADDAPTHSLPRDFIIMADEFANMPAMPSISEKITTLRSRRIWLVMAVQSTPQLEMVYGKHSSAILQDNCDLHLFIGCNNDETIESFVKSMGMKAGVKTTMNISNTGAVSASKHTEDVPVVHKSDLDRLTLGHFYVRARRAENLRSYMLPFFMQSHPAYPPERARPFRHFDPTENMYDIYEIVKKREAEEEDIPLSRRFSFN